MSGPLALACIATIVALVTFAYLVGSGELDDVLRRFEQDRRDRESRREWEARQRALNGPRVLR